jgi:hypothetical protein
VRPAAPPAALLLGLATALLPHLAQGQHRHADADAARPDRPGHAAHAAQTAEGGHAGHAGHGAPAADAAAPTARDRALATGTDGSVTPDRAAAQRELAAINSRMHADMNVPMTGNLNADFVRGMIPHHQGAIDMAELALKHSNDPFIRTLARGIIAAQRREITAMRAWLRERGIPER